MSKFVPPSAWSQTPAQRIARLRLFIESNKNRKGRARDQTKRYIEEIDEIENARLADKVSHL